MTAAHQRRGALELVPDPDEAPDADKTSNDSDAWRIKTVIDQYSSEHQLIGSLMWLTAPTAQPLLNLVPNNAIQRPQTRWAYELVRRVVDDGKTPTPPTVLAEGRRHAASDALDHTHAPTANQLHQLALYLFDAYSQAVAPTAAAATYAREVLNEAYRRAFDACGSRMQQLAASGVDRQDLTTQFASIRDELADLWRRAEEAAKPSRSSQ